MKLKVGTYFVSLDESVKDMLNAYHPVDGVDLEGDGVDLEGHSDMYDSLREGIMTKRPFKIFQAIQKDTLVLVYESDGLITELDIFDINILIQE